MSRADSTIHFDQCLGAMPAIPVNRLTIPDGMCWDARNVVVNETAVLESRRGTADFGLTSGPTAPIQYLFTERTSAVESLWATYSSSTIFKRYSAAAWSSVTISDTIATSDTTHACAYNGKVFWAYNSDQNRLHVYSESVMRRVGVGLVAAPTAANGGGGGVAIVRYYKVQMRIHLAADLTQARLASSELSVKVSFTPGANGVTVTKPTTIDSATHWAVYGSADDITYYQLSGSIAVATTTYLDNATPANYNTVTGIVAPEVGLFVPPPSCKFLATNGERLVMAGAWETTATAGQTTPSSRRVWFTRPLGATDQGDDEAITQTAESLYYLDIDNEDGSNITGLASAMDGAIYVFTATSVWRLSDTGSPEEPFRAQRVSASIGATSQRSIIFADTHDESSGLYFLSQDGPYRYTTARGMEWIGEDQFTKAPLSSGSVGSRYIGGYDPATQVVYFSTADYTGAAEAYTLRPAFLRRSGTTLRGGWIQYAFAYGASSSILSMAVYNNKIVFGGATTGGANPILFLYSYTADTDQGGAFSAWIRTRTVALHREGAGLARVNAPTIIQDAHAATVVTLHRDFSRGVDEVSDTVPATAPAGSNAHVTAMLVDGVELADARFLDVTLTTTSGTAGGGATTGGRSVYTVSIPIVPMEMP